MTTVKVHLTKSERRIATFSECDRYRYVLEIIWDARLPVCNFIGLNPSTATHERDDNTIRRCKAFAKAWNCGSLVMTNIFAWRATVRKDMKRAAFPIGEFGRFFTVTGREFANANDLYLYVKSRGAKFVIAAWGNDGEFRNRAKDVTGFLRQLHCLAISTKTGQPKHPLYLKGTLTPIPYP